MPHTPIEPLVVRRLGVKYWLTVWLLALDILMLSRNAWGVSTARLIAMIDRYKDGHGVTDAKLARRVGISRENLRQWRINGFRALPAQANLRSLARAIGQPYRQVLSAALLDTGYLTDEEQRLPRPYDEVLRDAVGVLTDAARLTNQPVRKSSSGQWEPDPDPRAALAVDWAEFVTLAVAGAAANVGGTEHALAGRPGSWEADLVRQMLQCTVGADDERLLAHRTEPVTVDLWVEAVLDGTNDTHYDAYRDAELELSRRAEAIDEPDDLPRGPFTADDPRIAGVEWIDVDDNGYLIIHAKTDFGADPADLALLTALHDEARASRAPTPGEIAYDEAHDAITALGDALEAQERQEHRDYAEQLYTAITQRLNAIGLVVPVTVSVTPAPPQHSSGDYQAHAPTYFSTSPIDRAVEEAIGATPTPSTLAGTPLTRLDDTRQAD